MNNRWWFPFRDMEQIAFKRVPEGYVYRAPNPWLIGRSRYYVVNAEQKAELSACHRQMWRHLFWAIVIGAGVAVPVAAPRFEEHSVVTLGISVLIGLVIGFAVNLHLAGKVRPLLAGLTPTAERITQSDAFKTQVAVFSRGYLIGFALLSFALFVLTMLAPLTGARWDFTTLIGAPLFGFGAIYWLVLYVAKRNRSAV
jgi:hypothetical protein